MRDVARLPLELNLRGKAKTGFSADQKTRLTSCFPARDHRSHKGGELWGITVFCPSSADWGNVADWAGAIASLIAVIAALFIAFRESWSLKKQRQLDENQQYLRLAELRAEIIRLAAEIELLAHDAFGGGRPQEDIANWQQTLQESIEGCRLQLIALQTLAAPDPRLFGLIGRMIGETKFEFDVDARGAELPNKLLQLEQAMTARREAIVALG